MLVYTQGMSGAVTYCAYVQVYVCCSAEACAMCVVTRFQANLDGAVK
jgi:hypothetical protein